MNEMIIFLSGLLVGWVVKSVINRVLGTGAGLIIFRQIELECICMLALSIEDAAFMKSAKHMLMKELDHDPNAIKITINEDDFTMEQWKKRSIERLLSHYPTNLTRIAMYDDWRGAMEYLDMNMPRGNNNGRR